MLDHDQRLKNLLQEFIAEFFELFFPEWAGRFDFTRVEWLDKEMFLDPPKGDKRFLDLVAKLPVKEAVATQQAVEADSWVAIIHIEIEGRDPAAAFRARMLEYYQILRMRKRLPVLPVALFMHVGMEGIGWDVYEERLWDKTLLRFEYMYVGLPALSAIEYVHGDKWLGVALASLMSKAKDQQSLVKAEAVKRMLEYNGSEYRRWLLGEVIQAYMPLDPDQQAEFDRLLETEQYKGVKEMATTWYEEGVEQGHRMVMQRLLEKRFGPVSDSIKARLMTYSLEKLESLTEAVLYAQSLRELGLED